MHLTKNGVTIQMDDAEIVAMALRRISGESYPSTLTGLTVPRIGASWHNGTFAGIARADDETPEDYPFIVLEAKPPKRLKWADGNAWAESVGGKMMTLREAPIARANVPELFEKEPYWLRDESAGDGGYAWFQYFSYGGQDGYRKGGELLVRAVRRLTIQ